MDEKLARELIAAMQELSRQLARITEPLRAKAVSDIAKSRRLDKLEAILQKTAGKPMTASEICRALRSVNAKTRKQVIDQCVSDGRLSVEVVTIASGTNGCKRARVYRWTGEQAKNSEEHTLETAGKFPEQ